MCTRRWRWTGRPKAKQPTDAISVRRNFHRAQGTHIGFRPPSSSANLTQSVGKSGLALPRKDGERQKACQPLPTTAQACARRGGFVADSDGPAETETETDRER